MDINLELYKIFYYTAKFQSFSHAAEKLYISQSAVSQSIKNLERKLNGQLFLRSKRSVQLTTEGEILFKHIEQAFNFIHAAETKLSELQNLNLGEVRIGVGDTICKYFLIPLLQAFNTKYPKVKIQVINRTSSQILDLLKTGLIDLGIVTLPVSEKNISVTDFITVEDIFVASNKFESLKERKINLEELSKYPLLMLPKESATRRNIDKFLKLKNIEITPEIELDSIDLLLEFSKIGLGIAHVLKESANLAIKNGELFRIETWQTLSPRKIGVATMTNLPLSNASREFAHFLNQNSLSV